MQEDPWNSITAGFLTGGFLQLRTGPRSAAKSAVFGGVLLVTPPPPPPPHTPLHCWLDSLPTAALPGRGNSVYSRCPCFLQTSTTPR